MRAKVFVGIGVLALTWSISAGACQKCEYILFNGWRCVTVAKGYDNCIKTTNGAGCKNEGATCPAGSGPGPGEPEHQDPFIAPDDTVEVAALDAAAIALYRSPRRLLMATCDYVIE